MKITLITISYQLQICFFSVRLLLLCWLIIIIIFHCHWHCIHIRLSEMGLIAYHSGSMCSGSQRDARKIPEERVRDAYFSSIFSVFVSFRIDSVNHLCWAYTNTKKWLKNKSIATNNARQLSTQTKLNNFHRNVRIFLSFLRLLLLLYSQCLENTKGFEFVTALSQLLHTHSSHTAHPQARPLHKTYIARPCKIPMHFTAPQFYTPQTLTAVRT